MRSLLIPRDCKSTRSSGRQDGHNLTCAHSEINNYATRPPHALTDALCREIEKYDQICDLMEAQLVRTDTPYLLPRRDSTVF